jgi:hypothetical protein
MKRTLCVAAASRPWTADSSRTTPGACTSRASKAALFQTYYSKVAQAF